MKRQEYLEKYTNAKTKEERIKVFKNYYGQFITDEVINTVIKMIGEKNILESKDDSFNDIPLKKWDLWAQIYCNLIYRKFKEVGDFWTPAGAVCVAKEAARIWKERQKLKVC